MNFHETEECYKLMNRVAKKIMIELYELFGKLDRNKNAKKKNI